MAEHDLGDIFRFSWEKWDAKLLIVLSTIIYIYIFFFSKVQIGDLSFYI